ncbi:MAG: Hsp70 family protein [Myxococcota bacterium]
MANKRSLVVGIDLGTTFCSVAYIDPGTSRPALMMVGDDYDEYVPSLVTVADGELVAGKAAWDRFMTGDEGQVARLFKRDIGVEKPFLKFGDKALHALDCTTELLRYLKRGAEANLPDAEISSAVITVPANFNSARRKATLQAAEAAGLQVLRLINEPTAALLAHAEMYKDIDLHQPGRYLVFDFGGGTLDVTAATTSLEGQGLADSEDGTPIKVVNSRGRDVGGMDIDQALYRELLAQFQEKHGFDPSVGHLEVQQQLMGLAIRMKEALSRSDRFPVNWAFQGKTLEFTLSRARYRELVEPILARAFGAVDLVMSEEKWSWNDVTRIFLIGGSCLIPFVKEHFLEYVGADKVWLRPQDCRKMVAYGAAMTPTLVTMSDKATAAVEALGTVVDSDETLIGKEPAPYSIGIVAVDPETRALVNSQILPRKTLVPTEGQLHRIFSTSSDQQETLELVVLQGESRRPDQNVLIGRFRFEGLTKRPKGQTQVRVTIDYDLDHNVQVTAEEVDRPGHTIKHRVLAEGLNANLKGILAEMTAQLSEATRAQELAPLDAVFIMDTTGSMFPVISRLKEALASMLDRLQQSIPGFRLALIGFSDHDQEEPEPFLLRVIDFSQDVPALQGEIARLRPTYGGDNPEAVEDALHAATRLSWSPHARRAIVLVGDAPPHGVGAPDDYFASGCPNGLVWEDQVQALLKLGVMFFTVLAYDREPDPTARRLWQELATRSEGKYFEFKEMANIPLVLEACCAVRAGVLEKWLTTLPAEVRRKVASSVSL